MSIQLGLTDDSEQTRAADTQRIRLRLLHERLNAIRSDLERSPSDRFAKLATLFPEVDSEPNVLVKDQFAKYFIEMKAGVRDRKPHIDPESRRSAYDTIPSHPGEAPRYGNVIIENVSLNVENLSIERLYIENLNVQINISKVDVFINLFEDIKQSSIANRLRELQVVAQSELRSKSVLPESARTMFNLFNLHVIERPVIGIGNDGMLESRWDNEDYTLNIMARFLPSNQIWYALFDHANDRYDNETTTVSEMAELISSYRPIPGLVK